MDNNIVKGLVAAIVIGSLVLLTTSFVGSGWLHTLGEFKDGTILQVCK